ncbi:Protein of unknown function [Pyronema omphalodes CBS 100304]|uniref:Uncharacterized protein n=1 Tax=Pyronema omphalodes (strain CBS 100304) TaxID=1076935 RepID=U4LJ57_PYROM|nr:Protein of unknown function [Pyronema omphalodes CBS 100304]
MEWMVRCETSGLKWVFVISSGCWIMWETVGSQGDDSWPGHTRIAKLLDSIRSLSTRWRE